MSILVRYVPSGLTREQYDAVSSKMEDAGAWPPDGLQLHVMFGDEGNLRVSEIWASRERFEAFAPRLLPVLQEVGVQLAGEPELFEVHELQQAQATA